MSDWATATVAALAVSQGNRCKGKVEISMELCSVLSHTDGRCVCVCVCVVVCVCAHACPRARVSHVDL